MKKVLPLLALITLITACTPSYDNSDGDLKLPPEMSDCKSYTLKDSWGSTVYAIHCPNSTTSTMTTGKYPKRTVVHSE